MSTKHSLQEIVVHTKLIWKKHCKVVFGTYFEVHNESNPSNSMFTRTHESITLGPTVNLEETHRLLCLNTGIVLNRRNFIYYPMPGIVIKKVNKWGKKMIREVYFSRLEFRNRTKEFLWDYEDDLDGLL